MAISLVISSAVAGGANGGTTAAVDTSGANLLVAYVITQGAVTVSDSKSNTWSALTNSVNGFLNGQFFYAKGATTGTGHTFTVSGSSSVSVIQVNAYSGADTVSPFDQQAVNNSG